MTHTLEDTIERLPGRYPGPGGAVAVLRDGVVVEKRAWGWADREKRVPFTEHTLFPVCSITKQFTCALLLDQVGDPAVLDAALAARLPKLPQPPAVRDLCHNQSGLRDYWALAMLCGAQVDGVFGPGDAHRLFAATQTLHFTPGTRFSYSNGNFRLISDLVEAHAGRPFAELLRSRVLDVAGMPTALLAPDTAALPGGAVGYEGSVAAGFVPAVNRIHWTGDAGLAASLEDMIAWEAFIDRTRDDANGLYHRLTVPVTFRDGAPARYGFGLNRLDFAGKTGTGHGGGLRGWRSERMYLPAERLSIVVLYNHMSDPRSAAMDLLDAATGTTRPPAPPPSLPDRSWAGTHREPETGLVVQLKPLGNGRLHVDYARTEMLDIAGPAAGNTSTTLSRSDDGLWMTRLTDNLRTRLEPLSGDAPGDVTGRFHSAELDATLVIESVGDVLYGAFEGWLGAGIMQPLLPSGPDVWRLPCPRALDFAAPGDWTLAIQRNAGGEVAAIEVGCWLARQVNFART